MVSDGETVGCSGTLASGRKRAARRTALRSGRNENVSDLACCYKYVADLRCLDDSRRFAAAAETARSKRGGAAAAGTEL
jgi:hypothetical protein